MAQYNVRGGSYAAICSSRDECEEMTVWTHRVLSNIQTTSPLRVRIKLELHVYALKL